jgi:hypothetical protein
MSFITASLQECHDKSILLSLSKLFGSSGIGNAFEMTAHANLLESNEYTHWCIGAEGSSW